MKWNRGIRGFGLSVWTMAAIFVFPAISGLSTSSGGPNRANTVLWDTGSPLADTGDTTSRTGWKIVPSNLFLLEANPAAAISDPGYSGREYSFEGDAVVENENLTAVFCSAKGRLAIRSKADSSVQSVEFIPLQLKGKPARVSRYIILRNTGDEVTLEVSFSGAAGENLVASFSFDQSGIVGVSPSRSMKGISLISPMEYGVVPDFIADDLVFGAREYPSVDTLHIPSDSLFLGLLKGSNDMLVVTLPQAGQHMSLALGGQQQERLIESLDVDNDGASVYLALLSAPGIWHREQLKASFLEKKVGVDWKRPFAAKWITQLFEAGVRTTYTFRESEDSIWRGVTGHYPYPVWFEGGNTYYHLSKKIPPKGDSVVYFLERKNTPASVSTPVDIMKETLGRQACEAILDIPGRKLRTHHRRGAEGVRRACTCGCTEAIQQVFEAGGEVERKDYVDGAVDDMVFFVRQHVARIEEYKAFAEEMLNFLSRTKKASPELKPFIENIETLVRQIPAEYDNQRENMKTLPYADELARQTKALTRKKDSKNLPAYLELGKRWRAMGGAQDNVVAEFHSWTRRLFQEAGYTCVGQPGAVGVADEIRTRCRRCLRNADGYEIWPDY